MPTLHHSEIKLRVGLDENRVPEELHWSAQDGGIENEQAKSILLSVWDPNNRETLKIDLWTKDMPVDDMKVFFHQTLVTLADTYERATQDPSLAADLRDFCAYFKDRMELGEP